MKSYVERDRILSLARQWWSQISLDWILLNLLCYLAGGLYAIKTRISCTVYSEPLKYALSPSAKVLLKGFKISFKILAAHCEFRIEASK